VARGWGLGVEFGALQGTGGFELLDCSRRAHGECTSKMRAYGVLVYGSGGKEVLFYAL